MHVHIGSHDFRLSQSLRTQVAQRLTRALKHGGRQVRQVEAWIDQAGEADKLCRIVVQVLPAESHAFESVAADAVSAVDVAATNVEAWLRPSPERSLTAASLPERHTGA